MPTIRQLAIVSVCIAALGTTCAAAEMTAETFFRPGKDLSRDYDPDKVYPQGQVFPLGFFGLNLARDKPEGLTLIGPYGREKNLAAAEEHGLHV